MIGLVGSFTTLLIYNAMYLLPCELINFSEWNSNILQIVKFHFIAQLFV